MVDYVLNEYVHVNYVRKVAGESVMCYEPFQRQPDMGTFEGTIVRTNGNRKNFRIDDMYVISEGVCIGTYCNGNNTMSINIYGNDIGEHYLEVSYDIKGEETINWKKEGF